jgi:cytochrome c
MKKLIKSIVFGIFVAVIGSVAFAADKGTTQEATALVKKAGAYLKANGAEKSYAVFNNPKGEFVDRDLYVYVLDASGLMLAHGANMKLVGKNLIDLKDADGKHFVKAALEAAASKGSGWVDYKWPNPVTKAIEQKTTYLEKVGDVIVLCGAYKN